MGNTFGLLAAESTDKENLYPHAAELIVGAVAFAIIFFFMWKWVLPRVNALLEERRQKIQGEMEKAEQAHHEADQELSQYKAQLAERGRGGEPHHRGGAADGRTAPHGSAGGAPSRSPRTIVARAQEEIRAERDRVFQELRTQVAEIAVELAGKVVGQALDPTAHTRLIDEYIDQVASGNGNN